MANGERSIPLDAFYKSFEEIISTYNKKLGLEKYQIDFENFVPEQLLRLNEGLIENIGIHKIVSYTIVEIMNNWRSVYLLTPSEPMNMHFRKIMECSTILRFLLKDEGRWTKYSLKWELYSLVTTFKRWGLIDRKDWHPETESNYNKIAPVYKTDYEKYKIFLRKEKAKKLTGVLENDLCLYARVSSWVSPRSFLDILESSDIDKSSLDLFYNWWSDSVHLSPINQISNDAQSIYGNYTEVGMIAITLELSKLIRILSVLTRRFEYFYYLSFLITNECIFRQAMSNPDGFVDRLMSGDRSMKTLTALTLGEISVERYVELGTTDFCEFKTSNDQFLCSK